MVTPFVSVVNVYLVDGSVLASVPVEPATSPQPGKLIVNHIWSLAGHMFKVFSTDRFVSIDISCTRSSTLWTDPSRLRTWQNTLPPVFCMQMPSHITQLFNDLLPHETAYFVFMIIN